MSERRKQDRRTGRRAILPGGIWTTAMAGLVGLAFAIAGLLYWSTNTADSLSLARQERLVSAILAQSVERVPHDQESVTVWDDSLIQLRKSPLDLDWLDANLGIWLHTYYGHDAAYVLDPKDRPLYAMSDGKRGKPTDFMRIRASAMPLVAELRTRLRSGAADDLPPNILTPGAADIIVADGHPAIVSVKPHVSDTGRIVQEPGAEFFHIGVRRLDGSYLAAVRNTYSIDGARFSWGDDTGAGERSHALRSRDGKLIGYFIWKPFAPGSAVFARLAPVLLAAFLVIALLVIVLLFRVTAGTRKLYESRAAAQHLAFHDPLTGLPNRSLFDDRLDHALAIYRETAEHRVALLCLDLDRFKRVNDTLGHPAGDELIREFSRRLGAIIRVTDTAARLGGDEFAIIQTEVSSFEETELLCRRIVEAASQPFMLAGTQVFVGVSIGVALAGKDGLDAAELTRKADIALYESKAHGRGRHKFFAPSMDEPIRAREAAERDLRAAIEAGDQLSVAYQPQYSAITGEIVGAEALVRWQHPERGQMPPAAFIPIAEETGLIEPLGEWVMAEACKAAKDWPIQTISINVSPVQLRNPHFGYRAIGIISDAGIDPARVELEITETALIDSATQFAVNLRLLRAFGIRIALDDFGTGYSSFSHLREFEVDRVKIDRTFVDKISVDAGGSALIRAIIDLARSTGLQTTAEGVETDEQKSFLQDIGCNELQGFFMAYPMPASEIGKLLEGKSSPGRDDAAESPKRTAVG
ncbi:putative bifunctional diguanylate cyclase/phosphodiesterase [Sphingosinicella rhizophila]|uniref:EAL domain-containing protein n=1 Tax=Sphingosinicella rhizophila TaxID=3050082 RepID=A0ABU3Q9U8_9SPHN|nr:EAL domain-containing protein [Sphingosinicella sp. GR2756]MDT9600186.1 EAL domain-containing protein [Sphingosinicella sp. GR2756]